MIDDSNRTRKQLGFLEACCQRFKIESIEASLWPARLEFRQHSRAVAVELVALALLRQPNFVERQSGFRRDCRDGGC